MTEADFDTVTTIAAERSDIGIFLSSTPTGARSKFYQACTDKSMGFTEHFHPSSHNPNWDATMEAQFRAQLTPSGYTHEIEADFGAQDTGVFNKDKVDKAMSFQNYYYNPLSVIQLDRVKREAENGTPTPINRVYDGIPVPRNTFRTMGVDWDKYQASSSILIMDYDIESKKFIVVKRIEVPKAEYSYDAAVNLIVELNEIYNPTWIYCDRGSGEYQIERLHIIGEERPETGLKHKVKGWQFANKIDVMDPVTKEMVKEPMKPFMVNQLIMAFEREQLILSPFDEILHKQLIDYEVVRQQQNGAPIFTSENEHFVDTLGLAFLAFVLEFTELTNTIKKVRYEMAMSSIQKRPGQKRVETSLRQAAASETSFSQQIEAAHHDGDLPGDRPTWTQVRNSSRRRSNGRGWGSRTGGATRTVW
ncbi:hypothetical protein [Kurthia sp. Dielmo]|uniref:hypothetical protein n=1 Tax=Kurthia sp. Dielmo TaxID=1033738 RepID=UPI00111F6C02|nr:hypothetical protein [Kurthia sp. Dielmo]